MHMRSEWNSSAAEFSPSSEIHMPKDPLGTAPQEFSLPANEISVSAMEFSEGAGRSGESGHHGGKHSSQRKMLKKMGYLVTSAVAAAAISLTIGGGTISDNVIAAGGSIHGDLRFTIQWNDRGYNPNDYDAHCTEPEGYEVFFENCGLTSPSGGSLDIDIVEPGSDIAVENILYENKKDMQEGTYVLSVHCFSHNGGTNGFHGEIALNGQTHTFDYPRNLPDDATVVIAKVTLRNGTFTLDKLI